MRMTTWRREIAKILSDRGLAWGDLLACTLSDEEMDRPFDAGWGSIEGAAFTAWTAELVLFPVVYDGTEWVGSVPRNPCDEATWHQGQ